MSWFGKKTEKSADAKKIEQLTRDLEQLRRENNALKESSQKEIKQYAEKLSSAEAEIYRLNKKAAKSNKKSRSENLPESQTKPLGGETSQKNGETSQKNEEQKELSENFKNELLSRYRLEIMRLKEFIVVWERALLSDGASDNKNRRAALARALKEILSFNEQECSLSELSDKVAYLTDFISGGRREEEGGIDLDEVLNPSGELNLEELCKELGVME